MVRDSLFQKALLKFRSDGFGPFLRSAIRFINRHFLGTRSTFIRRIWFEWNRLKLNRSYGDAAPDPFKIIFVDPNRVNSITWPTFYTDRYRRQGTFIVDGNWDVGSYDSNNRGVMPITDYWLYDVSAEYLKNNRSWENVNLCENNDTPSKRESVEKVVDLYDRITMDGYKSACELGKGNGFLPAEYDEVRVNIGRDGSVFLDDGRHRMCAVLLADDVDEIPVRVIARHKIWQDIRQKFANCSTISDLDDDLMKYRSHPDLREFT